MFLLLLMLQLLLLLLLVLFQEMVLLLLLLPGPCTGRTCDHSGAQLIKTVTHGLLLSQMSPHQTKKFPNVLAELVVFGPGCPRRC